MEAAGAQGPSSSVPAVPRDALRRVRTLPRRGQGRSVLLEGPDGARFVARSFPAGAASASTAVVLEHVRSTLEGAPGTAGPLSILAKGGRLHLLRAYVEGTTLEDRLQQGPLGVPEALQVAQGVLRALRTAHGRGILHGGVKPANVVLERSAGGPRRVVLVDFGVSEAEDVSALARDGRPEPGWYVSPEQAGLLDHPVGEWSDLYSVGVLLHHMLAGRVPFSGDRLGEVLRRHLDLPPPSLRAHGVPVPTGLDQVMERLLQKDPHGRYRCAAAVLADLEALTAALERGEADPTVVVGAHDRRDSLADPSFVGREEELGRLLGALQAAGRQAQWVHVEGESGGGKSRLLAEFQQRAAMEGAWVLRAQGRDRVAARPFSMLDALVPALRSLGPARRSTLARCLGDHAAAVCEALPSLAEVLGPGAAGSAGPEDFGEDRTRAALLALLDALPSLGAPAVLVVDDAQWADAATLRLLSDARGRGAEGPAGLLVVLVFRSEEVPGGHPLRRLAPNLEVRLDPMDASRVRQLAESMAGPLPQPAVDAVVRLSQGNPFLATSALRGLQECGALVPVQDGWRVDPARLAAAGASDRHAPFLARRLESLPLPVRHVLQVAAVLGKEFDLDPLAALAGPDAAQTLHALQEARRRHILYARGPAGRHAFTHDRLREAVLDGMDDATRSALHHRAAEHLRRRHTEQVFDLAYHYDAAGEADRALPFALDAAEQARRRYALDAAERYWRIAWAGAADAPEAIRYRILRGLGETLMLAGRYPEAAAELGAAQELAASPLDRAEVLGTIGELEFKQGNVEAAAAALETALGALGQPAPRSTTGAALRLPWEAARQALHTWAGPRRARRRTPAQLREAQLVARLYSRLAYVNWFLRGAVCCLWAHVREMNLAESLGQGEEAAQAYAEHGVALTQMPLFGRAFRYAQRSYQIRLDSGNVWGQGHALHFRGIVEYASGRLEQAVESLQEGQWILERTGDRWEANNSGVIQAYAQYRLGDLEGALRTAKRVHAEAVRIGDMAAEGLSLEAWSKAAGGRIPEGPIASALARCPESDAQTYEAVLQADGVRLLAQGAPEAAAARFRQAQQVTDRAGIRQEFVAPIPLWTATALRTQALDLPPWATARRRRLLREAARALARGRRLARSYPNNRAHAWREAAWLAALGGRPRKARRCLARSAAEAERLGMRHEAATTRRDRGLIGMALEWRGAAVDLEEGEAGLLRMAAGHGGRRAPLATLGLAERFGSLLEAGRRLASALDAEEVQARLHEAARGLLRAQGTQVLEVQGGRVALAGPAQSDPTLALLVEEAVRTGGVQVLDEPDGVSRSALAVPVLERGKARLVLLAVHDGVTGLFGDEEQRLARFVAALGGTALENARGFAELQEAHRHLRYQAGLLESQAEAMTDGLLVVDRDQRMVAYNRAFVRMWGLAPDVVERRDAAAAVQAVLDQVEDPEGFTQTIRQWYDSPEASGEDTLRLRDGRVLRRFTAPVRGEGGSVHGRIWHFRDVTREERASHALRTAYERLKEMDRMKTRFVNTAAHELNTPLTPMKLQVHLLSGPHSGGLGEKQRKAVAGLSRNLDRLERLVEDIMDAARLDAGRLRLETEDVDLCTLLQDACEGFLGQAARYRIDLQVHAPPGLRVRADPQRIAQVVDNLLSNALRFTPEGGSVVLRASTSADGARVQVEDTGPGLDDAQRAHLFEPFSQPLEAPPDRPPGTGLGLYICKGIVEQHGGSLWCEPRGHGTGAHFAFLLPDRGKLRSRRTVRRPARPKARREPRPPAGDPGGSPARGPAPRA